MFATEFQKIQYLYQSTNPENLFAYRNKITPELMTRRLGARNSDLPQQQQSITAQVVV